MKFLTTTLFLLTLLTSPCYNYGAPLDSSDCWSAFDVIAVCDGSDSIKPADFVHLRSFLIKIVEQLNLGDDAGRFGVVVYSSDVSDTINPSSNKIELIEWIKGTQHPMDGTHTDLGIAKMTQMFLSDNREATQIGMVITDGRSKNGTLTKMQAFKAKEEGIKMFAIAVGDAVDKQELTDIASGDDYIIKVEGYENLIPEIAKLGKLICPTTTTTTTTTTPTPLSTDKCSGCRIKNGVGYKANEADCNRYIQCTIGDDDSYIMAYDMPCPPGLYWSQDILNCIRSQDVVCKTGVCAKGHDVAVKGNCRVYHTCRDGQDWKKCCKPGYAFAYGGFASGDWMCRKKPSCTDDCNSEEEEETGCDLKGVDGQPTYLQEVHSRWIKMPCAPGSTWVQAKCKCDKHGPVHHQNECKPELDLQFDDRAKDSANWNWVQVKNVEFSNGHAIFTGDSRLMVPRFSNHDFGNGPLVIELKYKEDYPSDDLQGLVANGDCAEEPSFAIGTSKRGIEMKARTSNITTSLKFKKTTADWKIVWYLYYKGTFAGFVKPFGGDSFEEEFNRNVGTPLKRTQSALIIGDGYGYKNFQGKMDYVKVYLCMPFKSQKLEPGTY